MRLRELAASRVGCGYRRLYILLRRAGWEVNHKRVYRPYCEECLGLRGKPPRRRVACRKREIRPTAEARNQCWSMDYISDQLFDGRRLWVLVIVDNHTRESLTLAVGQRIRGIEVVAQLERICREHGFPKRIQVYNGSEFISKDLDRRAYWNHVELNFSRPGKPSDNVLIESFNSRFRQECPNQHWFLSLDDARHKIKAWRQDYNHQWPYSSLAYESPAVYAAKSKNAEVRVE